MSLRGTVILTLWAISTLVAILPGAVVAQDHRCDCGTQELDPVSSTLGRSMTGTEVALAAAGLSGLGAAAWIAGLHRRIILPLVPLWTRLSPHTITRHPARRRILEAIRKTPGITTVELVLETGINEGTLLYHLRVLDKASFVRSLKLGRELVWFEPGSTPMPQDPARLVALHAPGRRIMVEAISRAPGLTQAELSRRLGLSKATTHYHLQELAAAGLVEFKREGARVRCYLSHS